MGNATDELAELRHHYGEAYIITYRLGQFRAERRDNHAAIRANTADELLRLMREDYRAKPVPRDI